MRFFDTNILIYSEDAREGTKHVYAESMVKEAIAARELVVSTQVLLEFYSAVVRKKLLTGSQASALCRLWSRSHVVHSTLDFLLEGFELQQRYQLSVFDALIVRAAIDSGCHVLYTEDLQHGMRFGALEVVNPFLATPAVHEPAASYGAKRKSVISKKTPLKRAARRPR